MLECLQNIYVTCRVKMNRKDTRGKEMRLLHVTATHLNPTGGVPVVLYELVREQNEIEGFTARVLSLKASVSQMESEYFDSLENKSFETYVNEYKPDVVILHSFFYVEYNAVVRCLIKNNIPYLIEPHGSFGCEAMHKSRIKKWIANKTIFRRQLKYSRAYVFLNSAEQRDSVYRTERDIIIPNGIKPDKIIWDKRFKEKHLYFIGRYDINHKGLDYLMKALKIIDEKGIDIKVCFWGKGGKEDTNFLVREIKALRHIKVSEGGPIYGEHQSEVLEQLGPMLLTSRYEGFPMTILEAWAYGNPCIVTPGTNMYEEISNNNLGWGTMLDEEEIANTILFAVNDYLEHAELYIDHCKKYVSEKYAWKAIAMESFEKICKLMNAK